MEIFLGILIPFIGTTLGAACVLFMKKTLRKQVQRALAGFAAGVMVAASIWSLLIPAMNQSAELGKLAFLPAAVGFWLGILFLLFLDHIIPHLHMGAEPAEGPHTQLKRTTMLVYTPDIAWGMEISRRWERLRSRLESRSRIFRRERSYRCRSGQKG